MLSFLGPALIIFFFTPTKGEYTSVVLFSFQNIILYMWKSKFNKV